MCTLVILRRPDHDWPVIIGANRDEMIDRPARPPARHWPDRPEVVAGLDQLAGGSWLGVNDRGVVAGDPQPARLARPGAGPALARRAGARGARPRRRASPPPRRWRMLDPRAYRTFNLIVADNRDAFWLRHADPSGTLPVEVQPIADGLSMIAAGELDEPRRRGSAATARASPRRRRPIRTAATGRRGKRCSPTTRSRRRASRRAPCASSRERGFGTVSSALIAAAGASAAASAAGLPLRRLAARSRARGATSVA